MAIIDTYRGRRVLVTGDTGFKGGWLCHWLLDLGAEVHGLADAVPTTPALFDILGLQARIKHHLCDVRDLVAVRQVISEARPEIIFHLAAQSIVARSLAEPVHTITTNVLGTAHILEALRLWNQPCAAVIITSDKCYENLEWPWGYRETDPLGGKDPYSGSKAAAELLFRSYYHSYFADTDTIRLATCRAGNVIGGGDWAPGRIVPDCMRAWEHGEPVAIRSPMATRPWQHVLEPLGGYLLLGQNLLESSRVSGNSYNFGPAADQNRTVVELIRDLTRLWDQESAAEAYRVSDERRNSSEAVLLKLNCDKALFDLGWHATLRYEETLELTGRWYYAHYREHADMRALTSKQIKDYQALAEQRGHI